ncbi:MAG: four helix bundle protein [Clostridium sp.]|uniref:four helix bundle protein n=1 Tax=Clostridium sp. TaxID=1506 RepID=UPI003F40580D
MKSIIADKSFSFSIRIVCAYKYLITFKTEYILSKQMLRSGTSIGANVHEALYAQSSADFTHKMNIALKEASETEYWIKLLIQTDYFTQTQGSSLLKDCTELKKILHSIVKTSKQKKN